MHLGALYLAATVVAFFFVTRVCWRYFADEFEDESPVETAVLAVCLGILGAGLWPLLLAVWLFRRVLFPKTLKQREAELEARERRIRDLELRNGIL